MVYGKKITSVIKGKGESFFANAAVICDISPLTLCVDIRVISYCAKPYKG